MRGLALATIAAFGTFLVSTALSAQAWHRGCHGTDGLETSIPSSQGLIDRCEFDPECWSTEIERAREIRDRHPRALAVQRAFAVLIAEAPRSVREKLRPQLVAEVQRLGADLPDEPAVLYLVSYLIDNHEDATPPLRRALAIDPDFAWGHYALAARLAALAESPTDPRAIEAYEHDDAFAQLCPERFEAQLSHLRSSDPKARLERILPRLRFGLESEIEAGMYRSFPTLWDLELSIAEIAEHATARERVRHDVDRIRRLERFDDPGWYRSLLKGARLLADESGEEFGLQGLARVAPCDDLLIEGRLDRIRNASPSTDSGDPRAAQKSQGESVVAVTTLWIQRCPRSLSLLHAHYWALRDSAEGFSSERSTARERLLAAVRRGDEEFHTEPSVFFQVANGELPLGMPAADLLGLLDEDLASVEVNEKREAPRLARLPAERRTARLSDYANQRFENFRLRAHLHLRDFDAPEARTELGRMAQLLAESESFVRDLLHQKRGQYLELAGEVAEAERRSIDAIAFYEAALRDSPGLERAAKALARLLPLGSRPDSSARGSEVSMSKAAGTTHWESDGRIPLPFELPDLTGRRFSSAAFLGKVTLVNFWATWCQPCVIEMPYLHKLAEHFRRADGVVVLTISIDRVSAIIEPLVRKHGWTLPVLIGPDYFEHSEPAAVVPTSWLVDPDGRISLSSRGFGPTEAERWLRETIARIDALLAKSRSGG